jgi:uncharacterized membrane protein
MNTKTTISALAIFSIVALLTAVTASSIVSIAFAEPPSDDGKKGGPKDEKNYGLCKKDFNEKVCKKFT